MEVDQPPSDRAAGDGGPRPATGFAATLNRSVPVLEREDEYQTLTGPVREGRIPWTVPGYRTARTVVTRVRRGELRLPPAIKGLPAEVLEETAPDELALGLWLRREHRRDPPEVPAAHHLRFHAIEHFLALNADLLADEGLLKPDDEGDLIPDPLLVNELVQRPFDTALTPEGPPGFDAGEVLKAVARRVRQEE